MRRAGKQYGRHFPKFLSRRINNTMRPEIQSTTSLDVAAYCSVSPAFEATTSFDVVQAVKGFALVPYHIDRPFVKDYDAIASNGPGSWQSRFPIDDWCFLSARESGSWIGAAALVPDSSLVLATDEGRDAGVVWDLRVASAHRGKGVGRSLFSAAKDWARAQGKRRIVVETQNTNVSACRFYLAMGCELIEVERSAYPDFPDEVRLVFSRDLR